jgi:hypothetical protein
VTTALQKLYDLIDDIEIAMMTTRRADGHLRSRAMATQKPARGADLWFVTAAHSNKLREIDADPVHAAEFLSIEKPRPMLLFELAKGWLTGTEPDLGHMHTLDQPRRPLG